MSCSLRPSAVGVLITEAAGPAGAHGAAVEGEGVPAQPALLQVRPEHESSFSVSPQPHPFLSLSSHTLHLSYLSLLSFLPLAREVQVHLPPSTLANGTLYAHVFLAPEGRSPLMATHRPYMSAVVVPLTRYAVPMDTTFNLLSGATEVQICMWVFTGCPCISLQ